MEALLLLYLKSREVHMVDMIDEFEDFAEAFNCKSPEIEKFLNFAFRKSEMSEQILYFDWRSESD